MTAAGDTGWGVGWATRDGDEVACRIEDRQQHKMQREAKAVRAVGEAAHFVVSSCWISWLKLHQITGTLRFRLLFDSRGHRQARPLYLDGLQTTAATSCKETNK